MNEMPSVTPLTTPLTRGRNVIAVASGKGGVGKTWFSITLAHALAKAGQRVLLFDGDLGLANVDVQLGLMPKRDLGAVVDGSITLKAATHHASEVGYDIIAGRSGTASLGALPAQRLAGIREQLLDLAESYDRVVIDLGAGVDRIVRQLAVPTGTILVVTTDEPTSLTDAYAFIKLLHAAQPNADIRVIVNMASSRTDGERTYGIIRKACQNFLEFEPPLAGIIRRDRAVRDTIRSQTPLLVRSPTSQAAEDIETVADALITVSILKTRK